MVFSGLKIGMLPITPNEGTRRPDMLSCVDRVAYS